MPELIDEWAVDFSDQVGQHVRDGWVKCKSREQAERIAADLLDGKVMHRTVTPWTPADPIEALRERLSTPTGEDG